MKYTLILGLAAFIALPIAAQDRVFRCENNEYTNNATDAKARGCKVVEGGHVTVVESYKPPASTGTSGRTASSPTNAPRVEADEQRARDSDARAILEAELRRAEARSTSLQAEYKNGEPDKLGPETRNHQKYIDRVANLKAEIDRNENDMAGIRRELGRVNR